MTFGEKMKQLIEQRDTSLRKLAKITHYNLGHLSKVSNGHRLPSEKLAEILDDALDANGELVALVPPPRRPWAVAGNGGILNADDEERLVKATATPARLDAAAVDSLAAVLAGQRLTEDAIGSTPLIKPVRAQLAMIEDLVIEARGTVRPKIVHMAGQWSQFFGWLQANAGNVAEGQRWLDRALVWATEADEVDLISEVLSFKGHTAWMAGQVGPMIGLSAAALRGDGLYPGQYAISAAQEARGHAMVGDGYAMERKLDEADQYAAAARERREDAPPWLYYHSPGFFDLQRGHAYRYLGYREPAYNLKAITTLERGLKDLPPDMRTSEWAGEFVYQLGRAYHQHADRERAQILAAELAELAHRLGSARLARQAAGLRAGR